MKKRIYGVVVVALVVFAFCKSKKETTASTVKYKAETGDIIAMEPHPEPKVANSNVPEGLNLGNQAPEILLKNPKDSIIKLSSLRGKVVLIDFWASWCGPCRKENPTVVEAYNKYKDVKLKGSNGFTIYSVSLDSSKPGWEAAILKDNLIWPYHVSDLLGWNNAAAQKYAVNGIPTNYLIDANGIIIAKALRGEDLSKTLEGLVINK